MALGGGDRFSAAEPDAAGDLDETLGAVQPAPVALVPPRHLEAASRTDAEPAFDRFLAKYQAKYEGRRLPGQGSRSAARLS